MFDEAFAYKRWAMERTLDAVRAVDAQAFPASIAFARQQLNHIVIVEELFRARLLDEAPPHAATNTTDVPTLEMRPPTPPMSRRSRRWPRGCRRRTSGMSPIWPGWRPRSGTKRCASASPMAATVA